MQRCLRMHEDHLVQSWAQMIASAFLSGWSQWWTWSASPTCSCSSHFSLWAQMSDAAWLRRVFVLCFSTMSQTHDCVVSFIDGFCNNKKLLSFCSNMRRLCAVTPESVAPGTIYSCICPGGISRLWVKMCQRSSGGGRDGGRGGCTNCSVCLCFFLSPQTSPTPSVHRRISDHLQFLTRSGIIVTSRNLATT